MPSSTAPDPAKVKKVKGGYCESATKMITGLDAVLATYLPNLAILDRYKCSLKEKISMLKPYDSQMLKCLDDETAIALVIEQVDEFLGRIYTAILQTERYLSARAIKVVSGSRKTLATTSRTDPSKV